MSRVSVLPLLALLATPLAAQYSTDFEAPTFTGSAAGTPMAGQDGYYVPAVAGSIDGNVFTYAGNTLGVPANPSGGAQFYAGRGASARTQRTITVPPCVFVDFDVCCNYLGTSLTVVNNIGSFSFQPSTTSVYVNLLARWPVAVSPNPPLPWPSPTWNADIVDSTGAQISVADTNFQGLATNVWHHWGCTANLATGYYTEFRITNGVTNVTTVFRPSPPIALPLGGMPMPTDYRIFAGGLDDVFAVDNMVISYGADYSTYGAGCAGSLGVPTLAATPGSVPKDGTTLSVTLGNLPLNIAIMATGFSRTTAAGGAFNLPLDLGLFGFPGCNLLADPVNTSFLVGAGNTATWTLFIPPGPLFRGFNLYQQGFSLDTVPALAVTNGGHACIGQ